MRVTLWTINFGLVLATVVFEYYYFFTGHIIETLILAGMGTILVTILVINPGNVLDLSLSRHSNDGGKT